MSDEMEGFAVPAPGRGSSAPVTAAPVKTVEEWAAAKGMLPEFKSDSPPQGKPKKVMPRRHNKAFLIFAAAKGFHGWPVGKELTEAQFDEAVADATDVTRGKNIFR